MVGHIINPFHFLICVFTLTSFDCKPLPYKLDIVAISYDLKQKIQEEWCTNRKMARQGGCHITGFSTQFCYGLDMIRHFKLKFGTLMLNRYDAEELGKLLLAIPCTGNDVSPTSDSIFAEHIVDSTQYSKLFVTIKGKSQSPDKLGDVTDSNSNEYVRVGRINHASKEQSKVWMKDLNSSTEIGYENSYDIWIIPVTSITVVYIFIIAFLVHHRLKKFGYLCYEVAEVNETDTLSEQSDKKK